MPAVTTKPSKEAPTGSDRWQARIEAAFRREMFRSQEVGARLIAVVMPLVIVWVTIENGIVGAAVFYPLLVVLALLLILPYLLLRRGWYADWQEYVAAMLYALAVIVLMFLRPGDESDAIPWPLFLTFGNEAYLFVIVVAAVFTFSPRAILWRGIVAGLLLSLVTLWILSLPDTIGDLPDEAWRSWSYEQRIHAISDPHRVHVGKWVRQVLSLLIVSSALAVFVRQMRRLVFQQAQAERERANLSRYFSQNMVDELANTDEPLGPTRRQEVAVLFADIVGFTSWSEKHTPEEVLDLVRSFHARMERAIFAHKGTVDKYIGDAVMATFGTPRPTGKDAANAVDCVPTMLAAIRDWNQARAASGAEELHIGIGAHYGTVVLGDIGGDQRLEFAVLGDTVNVASRLERLTRELKVPALVSDALVAAARSQNADLSSLAELPSQAIRGRSGDLRVWAFHR